MAASVCIQPCLASFLCLVIRFPDRSAGEYDGLARLKHEAW